MTTLAERIEAMTCPEPMSGCLLWTASGDAKGYGQIMTTAPGGGPKRMRSHRLVWELSHGPIPPGSMVLHRCDTPACCNVEHLFLGTARANTRDMMAKGRGDVSGLALGQGVGAEHPMARLTEEQVLDARRRRAAGESIQSLADDLGVNRSTVSLAVNGKNWAHLPMP